MQLQILAFKKDAQISDAHVTIVIKRKKQKIFVGDITVL